MSAQQLTRAQAIAFDDSRAWESMSLIERAEFQIQQRLLCMPFAKFHEAVEARLGRPVWTHEFANQEALRAEMFDGVKPPTFAEIVAKLPADKTIVVIGQEGAL